jgi:prepilin-type N-terminal cleavage/methylation domain-containing protein
MQTNKKSGFTIVELLIVIVVIGILAALVLNTFSQAQVKARDTERLTDIKAIAKHLEVYYAEKGYYPTTNQMREANAAWIKANLKGLDSQAIINPNAPAGTINSINAAGSGVATNAYTYYSKDSSDVSCATEGACITYVLGWRDEATGTYKVN